LYTSLCKIIDDASNGDIDEGWPATTAKEKLLAWKLNVVIEPNNKNITMAHFEQPLGKLKLEQTQDVLELLGTKKIKMTYTGQKGAVSNRPYKKRKRLANSADNPPTASGATAATAAATSGLTQNNTTSTSTLTLTQTNITNTSSTSASTNTSSTSALTE
jgi:hypothetical protein